MFFSATPVKPFCSAHVHPHRHASPRRFPTVKKTQIAQQPKSPFCLLALQPKLLGQRGAALGWRGASLGRWGVTAALRGRGSVYWRRRGRVLKHASKIASFFIPFPLSYPQKKLFNSIFFLYLIWVCEFGLRTEVENGIPWIVSTLICRWLVKFKDRCW